MKTKAIFTCQQCGCQSPKWMGKCPECNNWNSFIEEDYGEASLKTGENRSFPKEDAVLINSVESIETKRIITKIDELDRTLGGGIVPGSVVLLAGDPGIGKSTLSLQIACRLCDSGHRVLYISGEESLTQVKLRAERLLAENVDNLYLLNQGDLNLICDAIKKISPVFVIIDSIQVVNSQDIASSCGSVSQVRECAGRLTNLAKTLNIAIFIIGHVTKDGAIAGPRVLEHIVDTVLYFEGERYSNYRILRSVKNRFGSTNEIGVFEMDMKGLREIKNPSQLFMAQRPHDASGSVVVAAMEGRRPILAEVQALVSRCNFGFPQRKTKGIDASRLSMLTAVLEKRSGLNLGTEDIFINVIGGITLDDPACDLGVAVSIASSFRNKAVFYDWIAMGEVGLAGEIRRVSYANARIKEAEKLGFKKCILPIANIKDKNFEQKNYKIECAGVANIKEAFDMYFS
ncbi:MAG: DNA repair protein RadA [Candidatus Omnitrophica bacterium CG11_big_fil_rev_8_21_14_0_20_42_13]|uniref:DNA repair protein RadA n=1 Tax=Candidatus Ghiorseimicrobium undicola TaxID=1974746 RepID=A0A2H0LYL8_9BACT|nr:MAG: DNA repair protein RadA [Candidatus Omnitrophica bacterium CG11_big_fil_rev_8_21_14_0_20_42_13]